MSSKKEKVVLRYMSGIWLACTTLSENKRHKVVRKERNRRGVGGKGIVTLRGV